KIALGTYPVLKTNARAGFDHQPGFNLRQENTVAVLLILGFKQLPAREGNQANRNAFRSKLFASPDNQLNFRTRCNQDQAWFPFAPVAKNVGALVASAGGMILFAVQNWQRLTG